MLVLYLILFLHPSSLSHLLKNLPFHFLRYRSTSVLSMFSLFNFDFNNEQISTIVFQVIIYLFKCRYLPERLVQKWNGWYKNGMVGNFVITFYTFITYNMAL